MRLNSIREPGDIECCRAPDCPGGGCRREPREARRTRERPSRGAVCTVGGLPCRRWVVTRFSRGACVHRNGTSMISLILPPKSQISAAAKMLGDEYGTASNIKSRVNRQSVLGAITSTQQRLKLFSKVPPNGL
eukprot:3223512-Prymnesium_polylepis.1